MLGAETTDESQISLFAKPAGKASKP